jgi:hypothetical protein
MSIGDIFRSFSRRTPAATPAPKSLTKTFRTRVLMRCRDTFGPAGFLQDFWAEMHTKLAYLHGTPSLSPAASRRDVVEDLLDFLGQCSDDHFLDFVEFIFQAECIYTIAHKDRLVEDIDEFFRVDDLPYALTGFVWTSSKVKQWGQEYDGMTLTSVPQVIRKDSEHIHSAVVTPVLELLRETRFATANVEFLAALSDYRHGRFGDALTKISSSFESVLKVICASKGWPHKASDTAAPLIGTVVKQAGLETFFEQPLMLIATMRNRLSTAHGGGTETRTVSAARAEYAINASAAAILFLVRETA